MKTQNLNYKTNFWGVILATAIVIATMPSLIDFFPDDLLWLKRIIQGIASITMAVASLMGFTQAKDRDVTGVGAEAERKPE